MTIPHIPRAGKLNIKVNSGEKIEPPAVENVSSSQSVATVEEEYSIEKFQRDYEHLLYLKVLPTIGEYDAERKKRLIGAIIGCVILSILGIFIFIKVSGRAAGDGLVLCVVAAGALWNWLKKSFEKKIKRKIMPTLMQAVPGFYWQETPPVTKEDITEAMIFPYDKQAAKEFDDCFLGRYRGVEVLMSECKYTVTQGKHTYTVFQGVVIRFEMNKKFEGLTVVRPKNMVMSDVKDLKKAKLEEVTLEDEAFNKEFAVYSTDQIEARYLLTTSFMERLFNLSGAFVSSATYCAFHDKYVYIAPHCDCDLFALGGLTRSVADPRQFEELFREFTSILSFVDYFKLDKKLGL